MFRSQSWFGGQTVFSSSSTNRYVEYQHDSCLTCLLVRRHCSAHSWLSVELTLMACCVLTPLGVSPAVLADTHCETAARLSTAASADQFGPWREAVGIEEPPWLCIYYPDRGLLLLGPSGDESLLEASDGLEVLPLRYSFSDGPCSGW
jgi:hypothetical protein